MSESNKMSDVEREYNFFGGAKRLWGGEGRWGVSSELMERAREFSDISPLGVAAPDFSGTLLNGKSVSLSQFRNDSNLFIMFGSISDPPCVSNMRTSKPSLVQLHEKYCDKGIEFLFIYTREGHPGENVPPHESIEQKRANALRFKEELNVPFPILVDRLDGDVHKKYGLLNNATFLVNRAGIVVYKSMFLDASELPSVFDDLLVWESLDDGSKPMKKSYSERIRLCQAAYDPASRELEMEVLKRNGPHIP